MITKEQINKYISENWWYFIKWGVGAYLCYQGAMLLVRAIEILGLYKPAELISAMPDEWRFIGYCMLIISTGYIGNIILNWGFKLLEPNSKEGEKADGKI